MYGLMTVLVQSSMCNHIWQRTTSGTKHCRGSDGVVCGMPVTVRSGIMADIRLPTGLPQLGVPGMLQFLVVPPPGHE